MPLFITGLAELVKSSKQRVPSPAAGEVCNSSGSSGAVPAQGWLSAGTCFAARTGGVALARERSPCLALPKSGWSWWIAPRSLMVCMRAGVPAMGPLSALECAWGREQAEWVCACLGQPWGLRRLLKGIFMQTNATWFFPPCGSKSKHLESS